MDPINENNTGIDSGNLHGMDKPEGIDIPQDNQSDVTAINGSKRTQFKEGNPGGPGRPVMSEGEKLIKKALKERVEEHIEKIADLLPDIPPILKEKINQKDLAAIREVHDVVGARIPKDLNLGGEVKLNIWKVIADKYETDSSTNNDIKQ